MTAMNPLVSKARKPKFELHLRIIDLNNIPLTSGHCYIKWALPSSTSTAENRGRTDRSPVKDHKVLFDYKKHILLKLLIDKSANLLPCSLNFEVVQDYSSPLKNEKITLGNISLNLAEYVEESEADGEEGVVRRYLMQDSKINSTLKVGIRMIQVDGERNFVAPPLKSAPVFGGIAGIMTGEQVERDDLGHLPMMNKSRDHGELQDMYRRTLAASWAAYPAEYPADQCVEDIFNGGDGWKHELSAPQIAGQFLDQEREGNLSDTDAKGKHRSSSRNHHRTLSGASATSQLSQNTVTVGARKGFHKHSKSGDTVGVEGILGQGGNESSSEGLSERRMGMRRPMEVDEFAVREDLVAWKLPGKEPGVVSF